MLSLYSRKKSSLSSEKSAFFYKELQKLKELIEKKEKKAASDLAKSLQNQVEILFPKSAFRKVLEYIPSLAFALVVATLIRQEWFEFYMIPSGSMRPTLKESDLVAVNKSSFSINTPLANNPLYFDDSLLKRGSIVVFSGENLPISDNYTRYFFLFPGVKQYVKRLIAKPGDTLYFYGGLIYGIDKEKREVFSLKEEEWIEKIEHIPFLSFKGKVKREKEEKGLGSFTFYQMNEPVAKLQFSAENKLEALMLAPYNKLKHYFDLWGFKNFGTVRLLLPFEKEQLHPYTFLPKAPFYLEIAHHPSLEKATVFLDEYNTGYPFLSYETSLIPLTEKQVERIRNHLFTARFIIKKGKAFRYGLSYESVKNSPFLPKAPSNIPDGTYEWDNGVAYQILWGGIAKKLDLSHPIYQKEETWLSTLFNLGIEWDTHFSPKKFPSPFVPSRYTYFREGDLYLMGSPIFLKNEENLRQFLEKEESLAKAFSGYFPFQDARPPIKEDGSLDISFIEKEGLRVPEGQYLVLGDNHSMSGDSREFGFVPQQNFKGKISFIFWPPKRIGSAFQTKTKILSFSNVVVWVSFLSVLLLAFFYQKRRKKRLLEKL